MNVNSFPYNPLVEKITNIIMVKTQNYDPHFFRTQVNFYLTLIPSLLNVNVNSPVTGGKIPINMYSIGLQPSGTGKGFSTTLMETHLLDSFRKEYLYSLFPKVSSMNLEMESVKRAQIDGTSEEEALLKIEKEFRSYGSFQFSFSEGSTTPAIKQYRNKILLAGLGAINIFIDEIGLNLSKSEDALTSFLELFDKGLIKNKLTKNTETSIRHQELVGSTPANLNIFGSPNKLLNGSKTEDEFFALLETGYARRCFFCFTSKKENELKLTPEQKYDLITSGSSEAELDVISHNLTTFANANLVGSSIDVPRDVGIELLAYRDFCEERASKMPEHAEIQRSEMNHRFFKALKLAGTYAFLDRTMDMSIEHLHQAIRFAEDSGEAVERLFYREKPYEKLAKFIADSQGIELTQVDLQNELPFYKGTISAKNEMMNLAIVWGYKNNIIIKKQFRDGIEFITGETLEPNDLTKPILAYSQYISSDYLNANGKASNYIPFANLSQLLTKDGYHWINHYSRNGNRQSADMIEGFNMVVLDIDSGVELEEVKLLLKDYQYIIHTTKRHQSVDPETGTQYGDRFRVILPINYTIKLSHEEYSEFMENLVNWLPFDGVDQATFQPNRKWATYANAEVFTNDGIILDATPFIPRTSRNEEYKRQVTELASMDNLERWFASKSEYGSRNNMLAKFGFMLLDAGLPVAEVKTRLLDFNGKLSNPLDESEIFSTIFRSLDRKGN